MYFLRDEKKCPLKNRYFFFPVHLFAAVRPTAVDLMAF